MNIKKGHKGFVSRPLPERFWALVQKSDGCWIWVGAKCRGYGSVWANGRQQKAHRTSFEMEVGPIPPGLHVCHRCDNPSCVRPDHLFLGTAKDNQSDCTAKGRKRTVASPGERNGARLHPERLARGDRNGVRTHPERIARGERQGSARFTAGDVLEMRRLHATGLTKTEIARRFHADHCTVGRIVRRKSWTHV